MDNIPVVRIYGERNTGTNYLAKIIESNFYVHILRLNTPVWIERYFTGALQEFLADVFFQVSFATNLGWKHQLVDSIHLGQFPLSKRTIFISITKNPYAWLLSLYRRPYHARQNFASFDEFLITPWRTVRRELASREFEVPVEMWNQKNAAYHNLGKSFTGLNLRYEDLIRDTNFALENIKREFGLRKKTIEYNNLRCGVKDIDKNIKFSDYQDYYLKELWRDKLTLQQIAVINEKLDTDLVKRLTYEIIVV